jgi:hypothetical protein
VSAKVTSIAIKTVTALMLQLLRLILEEAYSLVLVLMEIPVTVTSIVTSMWMELMQQCLNQTLEEVSLIILVLYVK